MSTRPICKSNRHPQRLPAKENPNMSGPCLACIVSFLMFACVLPTCYAEVNQKRLQDCDQIINDELAKKAAPGAVLLVGNGGKTIYEKAYGNKALEPDKQPMTTDTIFDMASCSKSIGCATSVMILWDRKMIDVHDPVAKYLPEFAANGKEKITIEHLLLHHSGLIPDNPMSDYNDGVETAWKRILEEKPKWEMDTHFAYSDMNFIVLGKLVEKVSGKSLPEFAKKEIFEPLGMKDTSYLPPSSWKSRTAPTEKRDGHWMIGEVHDPRAYALGGYAGHAGLFSTAQDTAKWCQMLINGGTLNGHRILSEATVKEMIKMRCLPDGTGCRGYGVDVDTPYSGARGKRFDKHNTFGHTGFTGTMFWVDPVHNCFVILLTNSVHPAGKGDVRHLRNLVATAVAEAILGPEQKDSGPAADGASERRSATGAPADVLCGVDVLKRDNFKQLDGRNVALITNQTGRDREGHRLVDVMASAKNYKLVRIVSPEHGLYGKLDEKVGNTTDEATGLPVFSLYGATRRPTTEMLDGIDTLVFDIQDVGARFYTYSATMGNCMEVAAEHKLKMVVLDRPNPITGLICEGPIADKEFLGFTAFRPIPVAHGMTFGELAKLFNEGFGIHCDLEVVPVENWKRAMWYDETGLTWINPSPNMRNPTQALLYTGVCLLEATNLSVGRGTDQPFELFGAPWINGQKLSAELNKANLAGVRFTPIEFTPEKGSKLGGQACQGVFITVTDRNVIEPVKVGVTLVWTLNKLFGDKFEVDKVVRLLQNKKALEAIKTADDPSKIADVWQSDLEQFKQMRAKYLMYE
jgi:uncharacterized protein YbbC (DUF1343 family)/CubicO group peptidase (beta-lactamase class C family)